MNPLLTNMPSIPQTLDPKPPSIIPANDKRASKTDNLKHRMKEEKTSEPKDVVEKPWKKRIVKFNFTTPKESDKSEPKPQLEDTQKQNELLLLKFFKSLNSDLETLTLFHDSRIRKGDFEIARALKIKIDYLNAKNAQLKATPVSTGHPFKKRTRVWDSNLGHFLASATNTKNAKKKSKPIPPKPVDDQRSLLLKRVVDAIEKIEHLHLLAETLLEKGHAEDHGEVEIAKAIFNKLIILQEQPSFYDQKELKLENNYTNSTFLIFPAYDCPSYTLQTEAQEY